MRIAFRAAVVAAVATAGTAVSVVAAPARAATCDATWVGPAGGDWATANNWSPAGVPTATTNVCVTSTAGPTIATGYAAVAQDATITGTAIRLDGTLHARNMDVTGSYLHGAGTLNAQAGDPFTGVRAGGRLRLDFTFLLVNGGNHDLCGQQLSICLNDTSRLRATSFELDNADVGGNTTAHPALASSDAYFRGQAQRVTVDADLPTMLVENPGNTTQFDRWEQLSADGTLTPTQVVVDGATLVVARLLLDVHGGEIRTTAVGDVRTTAGADALTGLTTVSAGRASFGVPKLAPQGGRLSTAPGASLYLYGNTTIRGTLENDGAFAAQDKLTADALEGSGATTLYGDTTVSSVTVSAGSLSLPVAMTLAAADGVTVAGGGYLVGAAHSSCATIRGALTMTGANTLQVSMVQPRVRCTALFSVTGAVSLPSTLTLQSPSRLKLGTRIVLVDAPAGVSGTFSTVVGQQVGHNHWQISYTATQVTATLVAGNV